MSNIESIEHFKEQYIESQGKHTFFKKTQKLESAKAVRSEEHTSELQSR